MGILLVLLTDLSLSLLLAEDAPEEASFEVFRPLLLYLP